MGKFVTLNSPQAVTKFWRQHEVDPTAWRSETTPTTTPTPTPRPTPVVKTATRTTLEKRNAIVAAIDTSAMALVRRGDALTMDDARSALFKADPSLYRDYREHSYSQGAIPMPSREGGYVEPGKVFQKVQAMAKELRDEDLWGKFAGMDEQALMGEVFKLYPSLWKDYREEVSGPLPKDPGRR